MNIKTSLETLAATVNQVKNTGSSAYIGSDGLFDSGTVKAYTANLQGLSRIQAETTLATAGLNAAQQEQIMSAIEAASATKTLTSQQMLEKLTSEMGSAADAKALLMKSGLITAEQLEKNSTIEITSVKLKEAMANGTLSASNASVIAGAFGITSANTGASVSFNLLTKAIWTNIKAMAKWLLTNPVGWGILATGAIVGVTKAIDFLVVSDDELTQKIKETETKWTELAKSIHESAYEFQSVKSEADNIIPKYAELAQGVDAYGNNISLSDEEFKEFLSLNNQLSKMFPELVLGYDSNGNAMLRLSGNADTLSESLYACVEAQRLATAQEIANTMPDLVEGDNGIIESVGLYEEQIKRKKEALNEWNEFVKHHRDSLYSDGKKQEDRFNSEDVISYAEALGVEREQIEHLIEYVDDGNHSGHYNYDKVFDNGAITTAISTAEKQIDDFSNRIEAKWKQLNPAISAWLSTDFLYQDLDVEGQNIISRLIGEIDFNSLGLKTSEDIQNYISDNIISPIYAMDSDSQKAFFEIFNLQDALKNGDLSVTEYKSKIDELLSQGNFSDNFKKFFKQAFNFDDPSKIIEDTTSSISRMTTSLTSLITASEGISSLTTAFKELTDNEYISLESIAKIKEIVGDSVANWDEYEKKLLSVKNGTAEYNSLMSDLTYATLEKQLGGVKNLANADEKYIERLLQENGVMNASAVAHTMLEQAKIRNQIQSLNLAKAIEDGSIVSLKNEVLQCGYTEGAFWNLVAQEQIFNSTTLNVGQKISALKSLEIQAGITNGVLSGLTGGSGLDKVNDAIALGVSTNKNGNITFNGKEYGKGQEAFNQAISDASIYAFQKDLKEKYKDITTKYTDIKVDYSGLGNSSSETKETFNWIETAISRLQRKITNFGKTVSATYKSWTTRNSELAEQIAAVNKEYSLQQQALDTYTAKAKAVNLPPSLKEKVREGTIAIEEHSGSTVEMIQEYQEWYEKTLACEDAMQDLKDELASLAKLEFDNVSKMFDNQLSGIEHETAMLDSYINLAETSGQLVSEKYYSALIKAEKDNSKLLEQEHTALTTALSEAMSTGNIEEYSEDWYSMMSSINDVEKALTDSKIALIEYENAARDLKWDNFDKLQERITQITEESDFLIDLMSDEKLVDDNGNMTDLGQASLGLHTANYQTYLAQAEKYAKELGKINEALAEDPYNQTLLEHQETLIQSQRDMISAAEDEKDALKDLYSEGYDALLNNMSEVIDKRKDMFSQIKDLYDYEKNIAEQTKEIAALEKQLSAYQGDDSEETRTTIQQLKVSLEEAKQNLEETEYDKYISDQEQMLDSLYSETEAWVNERLDNVDALIRNAIDSARINAESIMKTLQTVTNNVGITLSNKMDAIWSSGGTIGSVLAMIEKEFTASEENADKQAEEQLTATPEPTVTSPAPTTSNTPTTTSTSSSWGSWFVSKKDSYPKSKLRGETSIVDRLKLHDYDSSFHARASYYAAMGGSGTYTGSASQNQWMLSQMKSHAGFAKGGVIGNLINRSGEDGFALVRRGEGIIPTDMMPQWEELIQNLQPVNQVLAAARNVRLAENQHTIGNQNLTVNGVTLEFPNVKDANEFITDLQHSKRFENIIHEIAFGKGQLTKYKY